MISRVPANVARFPLVDVVSLRRFRSRGALTSGPTSPCVTRATAGGVNGRPLLDTLSTRTTRIGDHREIGSAAVPPGAECRAARGGPTDPDGAGYSAVVHEFGVRNLHRMDRVLRRDHLARPHPSRLSPGRPDEELILECHRRADGLGLSTYRDPRTGATVMTARYLRDRGYCCEAGCRHCPYVGAADDPEG